ncbi:MAG: DNA polymerase I [Dehalococcoidales bacterium]
MVLFDGNAIVHRAYHAFGPTKYRPGMPLTVSKTGEVVSAVYGFALMLLKVLNELKPTHFAIAFDKAGPTFRHEMFDDYKAQRPPTPDELIKQFGRVRQVVEAFHIPIFEVDKFEADDVLGTLSKQAAEKGVDTIIVTGDADMMQLVAPHVKVYYPKANNSFNIMQLFDATMVKEKFGVGPEHVADYKAMVGDTSDNFIGIPGIGKVYAVRLIQQFGGVEDVYKHLEEVTPPKVQEILKNNKDIAFQSKKLATIVTETPVTLNLDDCRVGKFDRQKAVELFRELEFNSLLPKLPVSDSDTTILTEAKSHPAPPCDYCVVATTADLNDLVKKLSSAASFAFDTETTGLNAMTAQLVGISLAIEPGKAYYVPVGHTVLDAVTQLPLQQVIDRLRPVFENVKIAKIGHNAKFDMMVLGECGINVNGLASDTMIAAHLLGEKSLGLKALAFSKLGIEMTPISNLIGTGAKQISMDKVDIKLAADYAAADADMTLRLDSMFHPELEKQGLMKLYQDVEMPLVPVLLEMERNGMAVDVDMLQELSLALGEQIGVLEQKIYDCVGHEFNINSPKQMSRELFEVLNLPKSRKTTLGYSTDAAVLEKLRNAHPVIEPILEYRQLFKLKSTYTDTLINLVNSKTGRVHTSFSQTQTATGRLSSNEPNLQNIPIRGELGGEIRQAFIAAPGLSLLGGDYSQIDLRALAHLSQDEALVRAFRNDEDIHSATAQLLFGVKKEEVTKDMRRFAKTVNFGVIYGMSDYGLEQATELSREEAGKFIKAYFEKYPGVRKYLDDTKEKARHEGYVETLLGRRRYIPDINSANRQVREAAERMAINMPVQGTSADIIKVAMINLYREMQKRHLASKMLLQVHDELVFEVPDDEVELMRKLVSDIMDSAVKLIVPLKVDTKVGKNWGEMK